MRVAAIKAVACGQMSSKLCENGKGPAMAPAVCSTVTIPSARTSGDNSAAVDSLKRALNRKGEA